MRGICTGTSGSDRVVMTVSSGRYGVVASVVARVVVCVGRIGVSRVPHRTLAGGCERFDAAVTFTWSPPSQATHVTGVEEIERNLLAAKAKEGTNTNDGNKAKD